MTIYIEVEEGYRTQIWHLAEPMGDTWMFGQFLLQLELNYRILIEVTKVSGEEGYVAFDDIIRDFLPENFSTK